MTLHSPSPDASRRLADQLAPLIMEQIERLAPARPEPLISDKALMAACQELGPAVDEFRAAKYTGREIASRRRLEKASGKVVSIMRKRQYRSRR